MRLLGHVTRRAIIALVAVYLVVSVAFVFVAATPDPNQALVAYSVAKKGGSAEEVREAIRAYREARNLDDPLLQRYARWMVDVSTLDWGISYSFERPVTSLILERLPYTAMYVVPALLLSLVNGVLIGLYAAFNRKGLFDRASSLVAYLGLGIPNFWLAEMVAVAFAVEVGSSRIGRPEFASEAFWSVAHLRAFVLPSLVLATGLFAGQLRYARAESMEYVNAEFVDALKAKGVSRLSVARHVLRNAAVPITSLFFTDMVAVLVVNIYVIEEIFGIQGLSALSLYAIEKRDMPVVIGTTMVIAFVGVAANFLQDVLYAVMDPRIGDTRR
ncbi:ABC transporter permease [Halorussus sp. MSC15.2]|uniref:ABC transporter permease n=1 Tax=Halorussus sp. MSC15.2 TaxID=2283638 RepID=UPI0013D798CE|nr:ABC transporter permease [Halorussus sp. MSC15.2]NEU56336.1 ABC transporter permease [Halorussus sp. MSC15.2]